MAETNATIQSGNGRGYTAQVNSAGSLHTSVENTVSANVENTVSVRAAGIAVHRSLVTVGTAGTTLVSARSGRRGLLIQNHGTGDIYVRFADSAANTSDLRIGAGALWDGSNFPYDGVVRARSATADESTLVLELA